MGCGKGREGKGVEWKGRELRRGSEKGDRIRETECGKTEGKGNKGHM